MEEQYKKTFDQMVDSLKMYQRYELKDKNRKSKSVGLVRLESKI